MYLAYNISLALTFVFSFALGLYTIILNPKSRVHQLWFLTCMGATVWSGSNFLFLWKSPDEDLGNFISIFTHSSALLAIVAYIHFVLVFLRRVKDYKWFLLFSYALALFFVVSFFIPLWFINGITSRAGFEVWYNFGPLYPFYILFITIFIIITIGLLFKEYKNADGLIKKQIFFILMAGVVGFGGGLTTSFPWLFNVYPFGVYLVFLYPILVTYGIFFPNIRIKV